MSFHRSLTAAIAVVLLASPLGAEGAAQDTLAVTLVPNAATVVTCSGPDSSALRLPMSGPAWTNVDVGARATTRAVAVHGILEPESSQSAAMMIVGGVAIFAGAIVSGKAGTAMMVGGAVVGLIGLWRYAR